MISFHKWLFESTEYVSEQEMFDYLLQVTDPQFISDETIPVLRDAAKIGELLNNIEDDRVEGDIIDLELYFPVSRIISKYTDREKIALLFLSEIKLSERYPAFKKYLKKLSYLGLNSGLPAHKRKHWDLPRD